MNAAADAPAAAAVPGWFGKLACLGDFASRRLPPEFLRACDTWLSSGIQASRAQLGADWLQTYLTSPVWRFAWAPDVIDAQWWFGVMMPSVDNVGRYFPLLVARPHEQAPDDGDAFDALERWFGDVAQAALGTLQPGATLDRFELELRASASLVRPAQEPAFGPAPVEETHWTDRTAWRFAAGHTLRESLHALAQHDAARRYRGRTLWWPLRSSGGEQRLTLAPGLPGADSFADLLQGAW